MKTLLKLFDWFMSKIKSMDCSAQKMEDVANTVMNDVELADKVISEIAPIIDDIRK